MDKCKHKTGIIIDRKDLRDLVAMNLKLDGFDVMILERGDKLVKTTAGAKLDAVLITPQSEGEGEVDPDLMRLSVEEATADIPLILFISDPARSLTGFDFVPYDLGNSAHPFDPKLLSEKILETCGNSSAVTPMDVLSVLTKLPGADWIDREIAERLRTGEKFSMIFIDIDHFRAFNRRYSYQKGDELLQATAKMLSEALESHPHARNFLGHRGSDDFVILTTDRSVDGIGEKIVEGFDEMIGRFYEVQDLARGYVVITDRRRNELKVPIATVSAVIISSSSRKLEHPAQIYEIADELLKYAKARGIQQSYCISESRADL